MVELVQYVGETVAYGSQNLSYGILEVLPPAGRSIRVDARAGGSLMSAYLLVDPESKVDFQHDWTDWLGDGDSISSRQWSITPLNDTSPETPILTNDTTSAVVVEGLQAGRVYRLTEHVVTTAGVEDERTIVLRCEDS